MADRIGYERLVIRSLAASGSCALLIGLVFGASFWVLVPLAWLWGAAVIADSAQFSTLVTQSVPPHAVGTALTLQTSLGFLLTMVTIQLVPPVVAVVGWRWTFTMLALGPAVGIMAMRQLRALRAGAGAIPTAAAPTGGAPCKSRHGACEGGHGLRRAVNRRPVGGTVLRHQPVTPIDGRLAHAACRDLHRT